MYTLLHGFPTAIISPWSFRDFRILAFAACLISGHAIAQSSPPSTVLDAANENPPAQPASVSPKNRLAVMPIDGNQPQIDDRVYQGISSAFLKTKRFQIAERAQIKKVFSETKFQNSGIVSEETASNLGKTMGVNFVVLGSYTYGMSEAAHPCQTKDGQDCSWVSYPTTITVNIRLVEVESVKMTESFTVNASADQRSQTESLNEALDDLDAKSAREVFNHFPLRGFVIKVISDKKALIDLGSESGLVQGDTYQIINRGQDIVHPVTGKIIKGEKIVVGEIKVETLDPETAVVVLKKGGPLKLAQEIESMPRKLGFWSGLMGNH